MRNCFIFVRQANLLKQQKAFPVTISTYAKTLICLSRKSTVIDLVTQFKNHPDAAWKQSEIMINDVGMVCYDAF